ncbi:ribosome-recycling factor, mitochondrial isoform X2 [Haemorhous mexicanus]|uniref:ribosome-recycling factor, mitochondrial isoform X2 n=1 Tax=Haemorhous mexicanus TaxID=30427 RepID=UPI0028BD909B|nr:ribosome-recycling factor, mitochondrial isoform X2 [Haemorhous mexicanus]
MPSVLPTSRSRPCPPSCRSAPAPFGLSPALPSCLSPLQVGRSGPGAMALALRCLRPLPALLLRRSPAEAPGLPRAPGGCPAPLPAGCGPCVQHMLPSRQLATKKAKGKGQSQAKVNISAALVEDIINLEETSEDMQAVIEALKEDFSRNLNVRTSPGALDHITVVTKDGKFPLNQLGQISQKSPQLLTVNMTSFPEALSLSWICKTTRSTTDQMPGFTVPFQPSPFPCIYEKSEHTHSPGCNALSVPC